MTQILKNVAKSSMERVAVVKCAKIAPLVTLDVTT